jgi:hypothetical protein
MNPVKAIAFSLLLANNLIYSVVAFSETSPSVPPRSNDNNKKATSSPEQNKATGTIVLRDKDNGICRLIVPEPGTAITYSFVNPPTPPGCSGWNDKTRSIQLAELPSATTIFLGDSGDCGKYSKNTWISLKTIKKQTSTSIIETEYLTTFQKNQIIEPGLQMVDLQVNSSFRDELSCIRIQTSAVPPSP